MFIFHFFFQFSNSALYTVISRNNLIISGNGIITQNDVRAYSEYSIITNIVIQEGIEEIGREAFSECINLKYIEIPSTVLSLYGNSFLRCRMLSVINVSKDNPNYSSDNQFALYNKDQTKHINNQNFNY